MLIGDLTEFYIQDKMVLIIKYILRIIYIKSFFIKKKMNNNILAKSIYTVYLL